MAGYAAIAAVGSSLERFLDACFRDDDPVPGVNPRTRAVLIRTNDFDQGNAQRIIPIRALSIYLYRVDFNKTMRAAWSGAKNRDGFSHLALDLHYLLTPWAENAVHEHRILGKAMQCLETTPIFSGPLLDPLGEWEANESVQVVLEEISTEAVMRTFDSLPVDYRLSVPYIARVICLREQQATPVEPVITAISGAAASTKI